MSARPLLWLSLLLLLGACPAAEAKDPQAVTAELAWEAGLAGRYLPGRIPFKDQPPDGVTPLAGLDHPRYARIRMADTKGLAIALDANPESPRLWVDRDFDGDLSDEKRIWLKRTGRVFERIQAVLLRYAGDDGPTPVELRFRYLPDKGDDYVQVWAHAHRRGTVVLGGRLRLVALVDGHADVRFDNPEKDQLFLDLNGNGRFDVTGDAPERIAFGKPFRAGTEGWIAQVPDRAGRRVRFERTSRVPPAAPRAWAPTTVSTPGATRTPPKESLKALTAKFESERNQPYVARYPTVTKIGFVGTRAAHDFLVAVAEKDKDKNLRGAAVRALGNKRYLSFAGDRVAAWARSGDATIRNAAAQALHDLDHPDREAIYRDMLTSTQAGALSNAARYLAAMRTPATRKAVLTAYHRAGTPQLRYPLYVNGLRTFAQGPPLDVMLAAVEEKYAPLSGSALQDLHKIGHPDLTRHALRLAKLRPVTFQVGNALALALGTHGGEQGVAALLGLFDDPKLHANVRKAITDQLRFLRDDASIKALVKALKAKSEVARGLAAEILAGVPRPAVTAALMTRAKKEKDPHVLAAVLEALGDHRDPAAIKTLLKFGKKRRKRDETKDLARRAAIRGLARMGLQDKYVRNFVLGLLDARAPVDRILALDAAAASNDVKWIPRVVPSLKHEAWQVRLAAVSALGALRAKGSIAALIDALAKEQNHRLRDAIAKALFGLTGQNFYDDVAVWKDWWGKHRADFVVPDRVPEMPMDDEGDTRAGFYGIPVRTRRVVFVIDQSGSMSAAGDVGGSSDDSDDLDRLQVAVREVLRAVSRLEDAARVNVILFHSTIHPWRDELQKLTRANRAALQRHLEQQKPNGGTNLYDGLEKALSLEDVDTVFLLSDGVPGAGKYIATPDILRAVRRLNQTRRIALHCVSIGVASALLERLAEEHGGQYVRR